VSDLLQALRAEFRDPDYRYAYAESFLNTKLATQIKILREQRQKTQAELSAAIGTKQSGFSRFEDVNHSVWKTDTLWKIARALDVRVDIAFKTFGTLAEEKQRFIKEALQCPDFEHDPVFAEPRAGAADGNSRARRNRRKFAVIDGRRHRPRVTKDGARDGGKVPGTMISLGSSLAASSTVGTYAMQR